MTNDLSLFARVLLFILFLLIGLTPIVFFWYMGANSFKTPREYMRSQIALPERLDFLNYRTMFAQFRILRAFINSCVIVAGTLVIEAVITSMAAFTFAKYDFRGKKTLFTFFISLMIVPPAILMLPMYTFFAKLNLINSHVGMIVIYIGLACPFALYFLSSHFRTIPKELIDSAKADGATYFGMFWKIAFPLGMPAILTLLILDFVWFWNELVLGLIFLQSNATKTMTVTVAQIGNRFNTNEPLLLTGLILGTIPTILTYLLASRYLVKGISAGAVKG